LLSRFQEGIVCFVKQPTNISEHLESVIKNLSHNIDTKDIEISYKIKKDVFQDLEASTFHVIVSNLFTNAVKFSHK